MEEGRDLAAKVLSRPGGGRTGPPVPGPAPVAEPAEATQDVSA